MIHAGVRRLPVIPPLLLMCGIVLSCGRSSPVEVLTVSLSNIDTFEYPTVNEDLEIVALVEPAFRAIAGRGTSDIELDRVGFSNEIADHVFEVKTLEPVRSLRDADEAIVSGIRRFSEVLQQEWGARLLPTAMHPWFVPQDGRLWTLATGAVFALQPLQYIPIVLGFACDTMATIVSSRSARRRSAWPAAGRMVASSGYGTIGASVPSKSSASSSRPSRVRRAAHSSMRSRACRIMVILRGRLVGVDSRLSLVRESAWWKHALAATRAVNYRYS